MAEQNVEFQGLDTILGVLSNMKANATPALAQSMFQVMLKAFNESQIQVPVRTGALQASGHLDPPEISNDSIELAIGYGGAAAEYAVWVHENLAAHHRPPTKAKFVEDPMKDVGPELNHLAAGMEEAMLRQYPQTPAQGAQAEATSDTNRGYGNASSARRRHAIATSPAFTPDEVRSALRRASAHPGTMIRKRKR